MNSIRKLNEINQKELEQNISYESSWHYDYRDTAYIYIGGLPFNLAEKDILIIFSQYGIPTHINLVKDRETGKSRGFCYLKYANFKSCVLAIDNLNGIKVFDRSIKVDHVYFKLRGNEKEDDYLVEYSEFNLPQVNNNRQEEKPAKSIEWKSLQEEDDELRDPMENLLTSKETTSSDANENNQVEDELRDPMEEFLSRDSNKSRHSSRRDSDREKHKRHERRHAERRHRPHEHSDRRSHRTREHRSRRSEDGKNDRVSEGPRDSDTDRHWSGEKSQNDDRERSPTR